MGVGAVSGEEIAELGAPWSEVLGRCVGTSGSDGLADLRTGRRWPLAECVLLVPLGDSSERIFCTGMNYVDHEGEAGAALGSSNGKSPVIFAKTLGAMADPFAQLTLDSSISSEFDWEVELGVVIGKGGRQIAPEDVPKHVAGFTVVNDVTARDLQRDFSQWFIGKNIDRSSPIGPWVTTLDEVGYPPVLTIRLSVNGVEKQSATTGDMVHDVGALISTVSRYIDLRPGDVFSTGTPAGVGFTRKPPEFLRPGDVVEAEIERVGALRNVIA